MISAEEIINESDQIRFLITVVETTQLGPKKQVHTDQSVYSSAINLSGSQLLVGFILLCPYSGCCGHFLPEVERSNTKVFPIPSSDCFVSRLLV
jgi:hypothetical protein